MLFIYNIRFGGPILNTEYFFNADFDVSLRSKGAGAFKPAQRQTIEELSLHAWPLADETDSILSHHPMPPDFIDYLTRKGIGSPKVTLLPAMTAQEKFTPFGWNKEAIIINNRHLKPNPHPPLDVIRKVNGRPFSAGLESTLWGDETTLAICKNKEELDRVLANAQEAFLLKSRHGNSALGNRRVLSGGLSKADDRWIMRILAEDNDLSVERWRERIVDLCSTFFVGTGGSVHNFETHEAIYTKDGAFIGALFDTSSAICGRWEKELRTTSTEVAGKLHNEGYFGPVCIDAFSWRDGHTERLRRLVDLNARLHVSAGAKRLWRRLPHSRVALWRFYNLRKLVIPGDYQELENQLGKNDYNPAKCSGILLTSPLRLDDHWPSKLAMLILGANRDEVLALDLEFRHRFDRTI